MFNNSIAISVITKSYPVFPGTENLSFSGDIQESVSGRSLEDPQDERDNIRITNLRPLSRS
jgi:hypothetical protein